MAAKPMLDGIELQQVQKIDGDQSEIFNQHQVPALEGDFHQDLGRRAARIRLNGVLTGPKAANHLVTLRTKFRAAAPVAFVADIATATKVNRMLIEEMGIRGLAGKPKGYAYALTLVEFIGPAKAKTPVQPSLPPPVLPGPNLNAGNLRVEALAGGQPGFDFRRAVVKVEGVGQNNLGISKMVSERRGHVWVGEGLPPGQYNVRVTVTDPPMSGVRAVQVRAAQSAEVAVPLNPGVTIARAFVVHFSVGSSFVEPAMMPVLRQAATYARAHPFEELLIAGHADAADAAKDKQSISEERARAVSACLTYGNTRRTTLAEWNVLRRGGSGQVHRVWGRREYQLILQELGYFQGQIGGDPHLTDAVVRDFQLDYGLPVDGIVGQATWTALIGAYLNQSGLAIPGDRFVRGSWAGMGVQRLVRNTGDAWRPNRRVELLFVKSGSRSSNPADWEILAAESDSIVVAGSIRLDDGTLCAGLPYVLTAPDGEYMDGEQAWGPGRGNPTPGHTAANGSFRYPAKPKGIGFYTLEIIGPFVARLASEPRSAAKGTRVVARLDGSRNFDVIISRR